MAADAYLVETGLLVLFSVTVGTITIALTALAAALVIALLPEDSE
jgi:predicted benzoate:H+ symporter BenE